MDTERADAPLLLIVEDDPAILISLGEIAAQAGYRVVEASNGPEAIAILNGCGDIGAMVTDVDLGGSFDGLQLADAVRYRFDGMRIVVTSGLTSIDTARMPDGAIFVAKPLSADKLQDALDAARR